MRGYVAKRRDRFYAVIYEGIDPIAGRNDVVGILPAPTGPTPNSSPNATSNNNATPAATDMIVLYIGVRAQGIFSA